jgi:hypothetical protein
MTIIEHKTYLVVRAIDTPVASNQVHHRTENGLVIHVHNMGLEWQASYPLDETIHGLDTSCLLVPGLVESDVAVYRTNHKEYQHGIQQDQTRLSDQHVVYNNKKKDCVLDCTSTTSPLYGMRQTTCHTKGN